MKNKYNLFKIIIVFSLLTMPAYAAKSVKVQAVTEFNSLRPATTMKVVTMERAEFKNGLVFEDGTLINGEIFDVKQPKRGKLNASFKFKPTSYTYLGKTQKIEDPEFVAKYKEYKEIDKVKIATSAATTAGGMLLKVPFLSQGVSFAKGMWKNPENNRLKSGVVQIYKDSPLSYIEEGKDIEIKEDTVFVLKFKSSDAEDLDNEEQTEETYSQEKNNETPVSNTVPTTPTTEEKEEVPSTPSDINMVHPEDVLREVELNLSKNKK